MLLVGINPAPPSVAAGHYYQGRMGQRLWSRLRGLGLLDDDPASWEDDAFVAAGNGLTDLVKRPTRSASEVSAGERASGREGLARKAREWEPGLILFAFRPPAEALLGPRVAPGQCDDFEGTPTFLLSGPYAPRAEAAAIDETLAALLRKHRRLAPRRRSDTTR